MTTTYEDRSHPSWFWTVQALYPPIAKGDRPTWHAVFFDNTRESCVKSMAWALDDSAYDHVLDFRIKEPTLARPTAGSPWESLSARRKAAKSLKSSDRAAEARQASARPSPEPEKAPERRTATKRATPAPRTRAADRFRKAARAKR